MTNEDPHSIRSVTRSRRSSGSSGRQTYDSGQHTNIKSSYEDAGRDDTSRVQIRDGEHSGIEREAPGNEDQDDEVRAAREVDDAIEAQR